ncbi:hypothetical protein BV25DRAFT_1986436 [Artomyces pyxidatus]|uniref:Uncharacterized protein n=1 Tax=Artomyces pyxidatus TaxID=48021 RepID=A0ACB8TKE3_9AGAM|nr:hypothetical protein BV25DRAFT_1986436 [Artomyces pyxidatus]
MAVDDPAMGLGPVIKALSPELSVHSSPSDSISAITSAFRDPSTSSPEAASTDVTTPSSNSSLHSNFRRKLKRNRIILSCQACHKRKQQCDRGRPCQRCVSRGSADRCTYEQAEELGKRKQVEPSFPEDLSERVGHLEGLVSSTLSSLEPSALAGLDALIQLLSTNHHALANRQALLSVPGVTINDSAVQVAAAALGQLSQQVIQEPAPSATPFGPIADILHHIRGSTTAPGLASLSDLQSHFPNQKVTTYLLSYYFDQSSHHWVWPVIHRPCFDNYYRTFSSGPLPPSMEYIALLAITCSTALQFLPESDQDAITFADYPQGRRVLKQRLAEFSASVLFTSADYPSSSIERIQALIMYSIYQWNECNAAESWYVASLAIRMAQTLAMNRDGTSTWRMRPQDAEIRRRLWWILYTIDRCHSMEYRRPYLIMEHHTDVQLPMNLDQVDVLDLPELVGKPLEEPTDSLFLLLQSRLQQICGQIWDQCFSVNVPAYRVVIDFEEQLRKFERELPATFIYQSTQTTIARPYLSFQNQLMIIEICNTRVQLLRPFLFIHPTKDSDMNELSERDRKVCHFHKYAKAICLAFCKRQLALMCLYSTQSLSRGQNAWAGLALVVFKPALMLGIAILMDTRNPENEELEEWISLAQGVLISMKPQNALAGKALQHLDVVRKRTQFVLGVTGHCHVEYDEAGEQIPCKGPMPMEPQRRIERATRILSQPQPSLVDLLGHEVVADPLWSVQRAGVFAGHFPGIESLSGPVSSADLENFLDSCLSMQSRLPHTFTF